MTFRAPLKRDTSASARIATSAVRHCAYLLGISDSWSAAHSHFPSSLTQVSVNRPVWSNGLPLYVPLLV